MEFKNQYGHQGDTQWFEVDVDFSKLKKIEPTFVAASEQSGSVHALCGDYEMFEAPDGWDGYVVRTIQECTLNHTFKTNLKDLKDNKILPPKDHRFSVIPAGTVLFTGIHRRANPLLAGFEKVKD